MSALPAAAVAVDESVVGSEQLVGSLITKRVTLEAASLTSPGGSRPMRRDFEQQPTPPAEWFGERALQVHNENIRKRAAVSTPSSKMHR